MSKVNIGIVLLAMVVVASGAFTDIDNAQYYGKINIPKTHAAIDANFGKVASGVGAGATALSVTNGQAVTASAGVYVLTGIGQADDSTNTVTIAAPTAAGQRLTLLVATASTNLVTIADSGTVAASGAILMDGNDTCELVAVDASTWCLLSESDN